MVRRAEIPFLCFALSATSCVVYDAALLDEGRAGATTDPEGDGDGDGSGGSGSGDGDIVGGGGEGSGGEDSGGSGSGAASSGGDAGDGDGGGGASETGGADGSGGEGSGGAPSCSEPSGQKGAISGVGESSLIEDFNRGWSSIGTGATYTGMWFVARDMDGTGIPDAIFDAYEQDPCAASGDKSLHVVGTGYTTWGASFDANLMFDVEELDASAYVGVTFWARTEDADLMKIGFSDGDETNGDTPIETTPIFIESEWTQHYVEFPETVTTDRLTVIHLVVSAADSFDFWLDDLTFYASP